MSIHMHGGSGGVLFREDGSKALHDVMHAFTRLLEFFL